jgi:hypothetical protein
MTTPPPLPGSTSPMLVLLNVLLWGTWLAITVVADFLAFMMFAFADAPGAGNAAALMMVPTFLWFGITFVGGVVLLTWRGLWQVPLAFGLAISPPFVVFAGYNILM